MSNAKPINIPPHLRGRIEHAIAKNNNKSLFDTVVMQKNADDKTVGRYLKKQHIRAVIERLPRFESETAADIALLRKEVQQVYSLIRHALFLLLAILVLGVVLCQL